MLMSSTNPLGSIPSSPAAVVTTAWFKISLRKKNASRNRRIPSGGIR